MGPFLQHYPEIDVQLRISDLSPDLIEDGFDLMVQVTDQPPEGLAGRPLGEVRQLLCASPEYLARHGTPDHPQALLRHSCLYLGETAGDHRWHLRRDGEQQVVAVHGRFVSNHSEARLQVALAHLASPACHTSPQPRHWPRAAWSRCCPAGATPVPTRVPPGCSGVRTANCRRSCVC